MDTQTRNREIAEALTALGLDLKFAWKAVANHASCKARDRLDEVHWEPPVIIVEKDVYRCGVTGPTWICNGEIEPQDVELVPHDFLDPCYLLPAVQAYFDSPHAAIDWEWYRVAEGWLVYFIDRVRNEDVQWKGVGATITEALANALHAALGVGE